MAEPGTPDSMLATPDEAFGPNDSLGSPASPGSVSSSEASTPLETPADGPEAASSTSDVPKRVPSLRTVSDPPNMNPSSTPLGILSNARRPPPAAASILGGGVMNDAMARARALHAQRMNKPAPPNPSSSSNNNDATNSPSSPSAANGPAGGALPGGVPANMKLPGGVPANMARPSLGGMPQSAPAVPTAKPSLASRRKPMMKLSDMGGGGGGSPAAGGPPKLSDMGSSGASDNSAATGGTGSSTGSKMDEFKKYIDSDKGWITFEGAATITRTGVNFANGQTFSISLDEVEVLDELGKGNYGVVYKVRHSKPQLPRFGTGLSGHKSSFLKRSGTGDSSFQENGEDGVQDTPSPKAGGTTGVVMAMKEMRLELEEAKFTTILRELVILHQCVSPYIIDFYGAFFQEGAVYMCIEYMDGGSIDKLYKGGIPEDVLRKITYATVMGLKTLKDQHNIIHRDVKPTNILINSKGQIKICDFGVSGNLVASIAKTNIGCQSYMAPERISGGGMTAGADGTYSVQSDIWSLGLTIIECAMGQYPYPPEVSSTIFSQLSAIVEGDPPDLPEGLYSSTARDFVQRCLNKVPKDRPTYTALLQHPWLASLSKPETIAEEAEEEAEAEAGADTMADAVGKLTLSSDFDEEVAAWVQGVKEKKKQGTYGEASAKPALHAAPLDASPTPTPLADTSLSVPAP